MNATIWVITGIAFASEDVCAQAIDFSQIDAFESMGTELGPYTGPLVRLGREDRDRMSAHKFRIGQMVTYRPGQRSQDVPPGGAYMITARLPESADGQFEYRIRNLNEQHERVAKEG